MVATVEQLAALVRGRLVGDGTLAIRSARTVAEAGPGDITFIESERFVKLLKGSPASAAIVGPHFNLGRQEAGPSLTVIEVDDPMAAFLAVRTHLNGEVAPRWTGVHPQAWVAPTAQIGQNVAIYPFAYVGDGADRGRRNHASPGRRHRRSLPARPGLHHPSQRGALRRRDSRRSGRSALRQRSRRRWLRLSPGRRPPRQGSAYRPARGRERRRDRLELHDRSRDLRDLADRRGNQDRQPRHDRPQQPDRPPQSSLRPGRHRRKLQDGRSRGHGRPGGHQGQHPDRRSRGRRCPGRRASQHSRRSERARLAGDSRPRAAPALPDDRAAARDASPASRADRAARRAGRLGPTPSQPSADAESGRREEPGS